MKENQKTMVTVLWNIDLTNLIKARKIFESFRKNLTTDQEKSGAVQAFEFCYELSWKTMKRLLEKKGVEVRSPRDCFREAALNGMIPDPKPWFIYGEKRNLTVHTYNEQTMESVIGIFNDFSVSLTEFFCYIEKEHAREHLFFK